MNWLLLTTLIATVDPSLIMANLGLVLRKLKTQCGYLTGDLTKISRTYSKNSSLLRHFLKALCIYCKKEGRKERAERGMRQKESQKESKIKRKKDEKINKK